MIFPINPIHPANNHVPINPMHPPILID